MEKVKKNRKETKKGSNAQGPQSFKVQLWYLVASNLNFLLLTLMPCFLSHNLNLNLGIDPKGFLNWKVLNPHQNNGVNSKSWQLALWLNVKHYLLCSAYIFKKLNVYFLFYFPLISFLLDYQVYLMGRFSKGLGKYQFSYADKQFHYYVM